jgi:hypothetical protein
MFLYSYLCYTRNDERMTDERSDEPLVRESIREMIISVLRGFGPFVRFGWRGASTLHGARSTVSALGLQNEYASGLLAALITAAELTYVKSLLCYLKWEYS